MSGDPGRGENPDDWFGAAEPGAVRPGSGQALGEDDATREDWLDAGTEPPQAPPRQGLTRVRLWLVVAALAIALLIGLAAAGVFSGGSTPKVTEPPTTATTPAQTATGTGTGTGATTTPAAAAPTTTLAFGDKGPQVKKLQQALKQLGYYNGKVDGDYGPATKAAVEKFQQDAGLAVDGIVGAKTLSALKSRLANP
jgi:hypothetical protein